ncbi:CC-NBS-LRR resistance protein [Trifolium pratense]|uniref:CC-NBS-LRR resistance protein n=1 Tax=Trifolium pratense TaxID=57577 RepID=A0A2K3PQE0_TRIPR|nr:CC-NBS-LRR resistance protein [Trifolium pratense]
MAGFMCDLVKPYVEKLVDKAIGEARYVFCYTCIVKEFEDERDTLEPSKTALEERVQVAKRKDKDIAAKVDIWQKNVDKLFKLDTKNKQTCFFKFCPNCIWRYKEGKKLVKNLELIKQLKEEEENRLVDIELPCRLPGVEQHSSENYISFKSRELKYKEILDALKDDNNYIIGLQGMGGTGKTTLAMEVGKELKQSKQFSLVIDTTVSFTPNVKKIQDEIAGPLGLKWEDCTESDRSTKLWSRLTQGEKILLIMDDVWEQKPPFDFDPIGIPKRDNRKGCTVLVTSRSKQVLIQMKCDKIIELDLLSEEEAWIMFKRCASISSSSANDLIGYGRLIVKECKQLPIAIAITASSLMGKHVDKWKGTLQSFRKIGSMHGVDDDLVGIYKSLQVSYENMMDEKAKGLFLICSLFREDEKIHIEVLTRLCIGAGVFEVDNSSYDEVRNKVSVAKHTLINSCMLFPVDEAHVKMHDLVRDVAQWIANREIQCVNLSDKNQKLLLGKEKNVKYLLCEGKVVDFLSCDDSLQSLSLSDSIQRLTNIRSMFFDTVDLGDISILGNLQSLETLDMVKCTISELPRGDEDYFSKETFKYCIQTAEGLHLTRINKWRNLMPDIVPINLGMNDLVELILKCDSKLQCLIDTKQIGFQVPNVFSKLVVLKLKEMEGLEELCNA